MRRTSIPFRAVALLLMLVIAIACADSGSENSGTSATVEATTDTRVPPSAAVTTTVQSEPTTTRNDTTATAPPTVTVAPAPSPTESSTEPTGSADEPDASAMHTVEVAEGTLELPEGLTISVFAEDLGSPRFMAVDDAGVVHVVDRSGGRIVELPDADGDGVADETVVVMDGLESPHSLAFFDDYLYVAETHQVVRVAYEPATGVTGDPEPIIENLPTGGHWSRTIAFGPDGMLYLSVGSSCNVCEEEDELRATVSRYNPDGTGGEIIATGLRNAVGIAFSPDGQLYATNNGRDMMGDDLPPENIFRVDEGVNYGWPRCHSGDIVDPDFGGDAACEGVGQPVVEMQAHSAPLGLTFASGEVLAAWEGDMLVAFHGSWNRSEPTGYKVVRIPFENGEATGEVFDFVVGWLQDDGENWGRPVDVLVAPDGSLLISDDTYGRIYRVSAE